MRPELILVVCAANICRSPLAELILRQTLKGVSGIDVASAGTSARDWRGICPEVEDFRDTESWSALARAHRSRAVSPELLEQAALVLVSCRAVRADVVLASPEVRGRTYTLREAAHLGEGFRQALSAGDLGPVAIYAEYLDRARVVRGTASGGRWPWRHSRRADAMDIRDGHGAGARSHRAALEAASAAAATIARQLSARSPEPLA